MTGRINRVRLWGMKWDIKGVWKADGAEGSMSVEAPNQRAAESIAMQRGMMVEQALPEVAVALEYAGPTTPPLPVQPKPVKTPAGSIPCQACGDFMFKNTVSSGNASGIAVALIVFCIGVVITIAIPLLGWVIGPIICICSLGMGGKRSKVWRCRKCRTILPRA